MERIILGNNLLMNIIKFNIMTKIMQCSCQSEFQDATYGKSMRVFNEIGKDQKGGYRCTVCGKESSASSPKKK